MRPRKNARLPGNYPTEGCGIPMRITRLFPMKLKDVTVASLKDSKKESDVICIPEMMSLFDCFEKNDFNTSVCQQQAKALEHCYTTHTARKNEVKTKKIQQATLTNNKQKLTL